MIVSKSDPQGCFVNAGLAILAFLFYAIGYVASAFIGPALIIASLSNSSLTFFLWGIITFLIAGTLLRISQAINSGNYEKIGDLKFWMGKDKTFKI
tara:strand:+ start:267 stop:554 length:288 start_codon:yes stop_codon:yes gene_type:complete